MSSDSRHFDSDRAQGVLIGLAAGDKNLGPIEMVLMIAASLIAKGEFDIADITDRWLDWWQRGAWDTGQVFDKVMEMIDAGVEPEMAAEYTHDELGGMTAGCNGAHRVPVLAACPHIADVDLDDVARQLTAMTHHHILAQDAAVAIARLCRKLIYGESIDVAVKTVGRGLDAEIQASIENSRYAPGGIGGFSPDTLQSALHFVLTRVNFTSALNDALVYAGPPNYCPVLVGAIAGARWGAGEIDLEMLNRCKDRERVLSAARSLITRNAG